MKNRKISFGAILAALSGCLFLLARLSPFSDIWIYCLVSLCVALFCERYGISDAINFYIVLTILSFFLLAPFMNMAFVLFFGPWPIILAYLGRYYHSRVKYFLLKYASASVLLSCFVLLFFFIFPHELRQRMLASIDKLAVRFDLKGFIYPILVLAYYFGINIYQHLLLRLLKQAKGLISGILK